MKCATLAQGNQVLSLIMQKGLNSDQIQQLMSSGTLDMLLAASMMRNINSLDLFKIMEALGLEQIDYMTCGGKVVVKNDHQSVGKERQKMPINEYIKLYLGRAFGVDVSGLIEGVYDEKMIMTETTLKLFAVNRIGINGCLEVFDKHSIIPATRRELAGFVHANSRAGSSITDGLNARIYALGSCIKNDESPRYWQYPYIEYTKGKFNACGIVNRDNVTITNGGNIEECARTFFLGRFKSRSED